MNEQQRCNNCMSIFNEELTECPDCGRDDALMYPFEPEERE
jgi:rRNA maturation endonuclease Nob1